MKIRHKQSGVVLEGAFDERAYWVGSTRHEYFGLVPESSTYDKKEWEEVKPVWRDVTAECLTNENGAVYHGELPVAFTDGYRFRKVQRYGVKSVDPAACFIIEQRQA